MDVGSVIKDLRKQKGYTQREFAHALGLTQTSISHIESGLVKPHPSTVIRICDFLKLSEPVLYFMAMSESDIPVEKREIFKNIFPSLKKALIEIFI